MKENNGFKINIGLNVIGKRNDGYHNIESIFYPVDLVKDEIEIDISCTETTFDVVNADFECNSEDNLCMRAYRLLSKDYDLPNLHIRLTKNIPSGAGVGGGSANAALMLHLLNRFCNLTIDNDKLKEYASQLGSDVPFFIDNIPAYVTGRGEKMEALDFSLEKHKIKLAFQRLPISTPALYKQITPSKSSFYLPDIKKLPLNEWKFYIKNDFEAIVFKQYPELQKVKDELYDSGALYVSMTGSGSAIYGIF